MPSATAGFDQNVFVNCPFDDDYLPILQAILFCLIDCNLVPRIATERIDSGEQRLEKIVELVQSSRYSIHDLSRVQSSDPDEYARLNMPFELGIDVGLARSGSAAYASKKLLVIARDPYKYQIAISDIAGWDIRPHADDYEQAVREVRRWLHSLRLTELGASQIIGHFYDFQAWDFERLLGAGWDEDDIRDRQTPELLDAMNSWVAAGRPA